MRTLSKTLIIDTATRHIFLSLVIDGKERQCVYQEGINNHSVTIIPFLKEMLDKEQLQLHDIDTLIVGIGPGSYTGVRIGVTVAKMIGYLNHTTVKTVSSLALMASASDADLVIPYIDARRGNAFIATFQQKENILTYLEKDALKNLDTYLAKQKKDYDLIGEGQPNVMKIIDSDLTETVEDIHALTPNYLRITEAERNRYGNHH